ncbi:MAG: ABC transporter [Planctomycetota bacterium]|nr:MAG: ABC transporter [Planctomycetota bacterium]
MKKKRTALAGLLAVLVLFLAVNLIAGLTLRHARIDMTAEGIYSLSDGTREILAAIDEPIRLELYEYLDEIEEDRPDLVAHARRIREFLEELVLAADGGLELVVRKPEPYSEAEDEARAAGVAAVPLGDRLFSLGLVARNSVDEQEVIPFFRPGPDRDAFLEYDLAKIIHSLSQPEKPKIGLLSSLQLDARIDPTNPRAGMTPAWQILSQLRSLYEVEIIDKEAGELPADLDVLVLVHPKELSEEMLRAIDQFALAGGRILAFLDPSCQEERQQQANPYGPPPTPGPSDLGPLLAAWGVDWDPEQVVADRDRALQVPVPSQHGYQYVDHVGYLGLTADDMVEGDPVSGMLKTVRMAMPGELKAAEGATTTFEPLITSSANAMLLPASRFAYLSDPGTLLSSFLGDGQRHVLAARITGPLVTAYPPAEGEEPAEGVLTESSEDARIILVADADLLADYLWVQEEKIGPISLGLRVTADNGNLVLNAVELLGGSPALAKIRGRRSYERPFVVVERLKREADDRYRAREEQLEQQIRDAEARINELQRQKTDDASALILSPEQQAELEKLEKEMLAARKELRQVRHELNKDIESLGTRLMLANTAGVPLLVAVLAFLWHFRRSRRQRAA